MTDTSQQELIPRPLQAAAILQIISGLINIFLVSWISWFGISCVCSAITFPLLSIGGFCGFASLFLIPLGMLEIGAGVYGYLNPREAAGTMKLLAWLELLSLLVGAVPAALVGGVVHLFLRGDDVLLYLEG